MLAFAVAAFFLIALALGFLLWPLLADLPKRTLVTRAESNKAILRSERDELAADIAQGRLQGDSAQEAIAELAESAQRDLAATDASLTIEPRRWKLAAVLAIALPSAAFGLYAAFGTPQALDKNAVAAITAAAQRDSASQESPASSERPAMNDQQVLEMVEALKTRMEKNPDDPRGMQLLARSMAAMGRYEESAAAYEKLTKLLPNDAQVLADYADVLGVANNMNLSGKPTAIIEQALKIDPNNNKALALLATAALNSGQFDKSLALWNKLRSTLPAGSPDIAQVDAVIAEVNERKKGGSAVKPAPARPSTATATTTTAPAASTAPAAAGATSISGSKGAHC
jgi:cytochrome c-type biogenesis protein CcmH